ncbi:M23 family metallopeptidase [Nocardioides caldifontis]|uniref:M23 family metallopeptidase n=1 Tax=Nocardioides caldifontis TaxID=2588938 RepID=UPI0011DF6085|nr:M23 family metallopeptidase [Nocardioides caldifontis]
MVLVMSVTNSRRRVATLVMGALISMLLPVSLADAADLEDRQRELNGQIDRAGRHLDQSTAEWLEAIGAMERAEDELAAAHQRLAEAQTAVATARALHEPIEAKLRSAEGASGEAEALVSRAQQEIDEEMAVLRAAVIDSVQGASPSVMALGALLNSQTPEDITRQSGASQAFADAQLASVQRLEAARTVLQVQEQRLAEAEARVAEQEIAARKVVLEQTELLRRAKKAEAEVADLTETLKAKRVAAARAKARDSALLQDLERERNRVAQLLFPGGGDGAAAGAFPADSGPMMRPVDGSVTSPFGMRMHPIYKEWKLHDGTDMAAACGTPVRAASGGRILEAYFHSAYGNRIIMDNGNQGGVGVGTTYNHLSEFAVSKGQWVQRGDVIGYAGTTGASTGCHLHFMVLKDGTPVDPMGWV